MCQNLIKLNSFITKKYEDNHVSKFNKIKSMYVKK